MSCNCGNPKCNGECGFSPAVLQINNRECVLFSKVDVPASMGDETTYPPKPGKYKNVVLHYKSTKASFLYTSDGIPIRISADPDSIPIATTTTPGGIIVGNGLEVNAGGVLSVSGGAITIDDEMSLASENPVQNKVISSALNTKADTSSVPTKTSDLQNDSGFIDELPIASVQELGGIKVGVGLEIDPNGVLSATGLTSVGWDEIQNKPNFATVATTGDYDDLTDTPNLASVATTGDYDDLINQPTIPTIILTDIDPGEGSVLAENTFIAVFQGSSS